MNKTTPLNTSMNHNDFSNDDELEEIHFKRVLKAFSTYSSRMKRKIIKHYDDWDRLSTEDQEIIPEYKNKLDEIYALFQVNQDFFDSIVSYTTGKDKYCEGDEPEIFDLRLTPTDRDYDNLRSTLRQLVREWSDEGSIERKMCFTPILNCIKESFKSGDLDGIKILVPGAGLGRLAWEINRMGFTVQGNEFSLYMLLTSQFILNNCPKPRQIFIHPFVTPLSNHLSRENSCRAISIPDVTADTGQENSGDFSMTAGDFLEIYSQPDEIGKWDCIVTCFFLDTAQNVLQYLRVIRGALKPGGLWINLGPLQYHFEESFSDISIELTWNEVVLAAERLQFKFERQNVLDEWQAYAHDRLGLSRTMYRAVFSVARVN